MPTLSLGDNRVEIGVQRIKTAGHGQ